MLAKLGHVGMGVGMMCASTTINITINITITITQTILEPSSPIALDTRRTCCRCHTPAGAGGCGQ